MQLHWSQTCNHFTLLCGSAGGAVLTCCAPFVNIQFLGSSLTFMMVRATAFCSLQTTQKDSVAKSSSSRQQVARLAGVRVGTTASVCHPKLPGNLHLHSTLPALGAAGLQCGPAQLACGGLDGHACRCPTTTSSIWAMPILLPDQNFALPCCHSSIVKSLLRKLICM